MAPLCPLKFQFQDDLCLVLNTHAVRICFRHPKQRQPRQFDQTCDVQHKSKSRIMDQQLGEKINAAIEVPNVELK